MVAELDWTTDVSMERMMRERTAVGGGNLMNNLLDPPERLARHMVDTLLEWIEKPGG